MPTILPFLVLVTLPLAQPGEAVTVRLTQKALVARCLDGVAVKEGARQWQLAPGPHTLALTTHNQPRSGVPTEDPGVGAIPFTIEPGHRYEVELRAPAASYSSRVWKKGDWTPVVRDRTTDRIVSGEVAWTDGGCR